MQFETARMYASRSNMRPPVGSMQRLQRGQSLVEMTIALIVLVPLAIGVALLGRYIHVRHEVQMAARRAAWDAAASPALANKGLPDKAKEQSRLRDRSFDDAGAVITSNTSVPQEFSDSMLTIVSGHQLLTPRDVTLTVYKQEKAPSFLDKAMDIVSKVPRAAGLDTLPPNPKGLVTAEVHASTRELIGRDGRVLDFLGPIAGKRLDFSARTVLLADSWGAAGSGEKMGGGARGGGPHHNRTVRAVIRPLVPTTWFAGPLKPILDTVTNLLKRLPLVGAGLGGFEFGRTAPDVVPDDKLVPYKNVH